MTQSGACNVCNVEVVGSSPIGSTGGEMRIVVRVTERYYDRVLEKIRARGFSRIRENKALCLISFELPKTK